MSLRESPVHFLNLGLEPAPPAIQALLQRRRIVPSQYQFDLRAIVNQFLGMVDQLGIDPGQRVNLLPISSAERANAALLGKHSSTIILDLGFIEILSDYLIVKFGLHEHVEIGPDDHVYWPEARSEATREERQLLQENVRKSLGHTWDFGGNESEREPDEIKHEPLTITGSQMFRDAAARLMVTGFPDGYRQDIFEAFCLWPHSVGPHEYRAGPLLANQMLRAPGVDDRVRQQYRMFMQTGVLQILAHEFAHCLFPARDAAARWQSSSEVAAMNAEIRRVSDALTTLQNGHPDRIWHSLTLAADDRDHRLRRAWSEAFFDLRGLEMIIAAERLPRDADHVELYFCILLDLTCSNIAIMIMRDAMAGAMDSRTGMYRSMRDALVETLHRSCLVFAGLCATYRQHFPEREPARLNAKIEEVSEKTEMLANFYMADLCNNLPDLPYADEKFSDYEERAWAEFIGVIKSSTLP